MLDTFYTGLPNRILFDHGSAFAKQFLAFVRLSSVYVSHAGVESHNFFGLGRRYNHPLRTTFRKLEITNQQLPKQLLLSLSVKAMNYTLGSQGLVPSAVIFVEFLQLRWAGEAAIPRPTLTVCICCPSSPTRDGDHLGTDSSAARPSS